jgi:hypothetical protein
MQGNAADGHFYANKPGRKGNLLILAFWMKSLGDLNLED